MKKQKNKIQKHPISQANTQKGKGKKDVAIGIAKWAIVALLVYTALIYARALFNNFANWDDDEYLQKNPFLEDFSLEGISAIFSSFYFGNYHPLTTLTYLVEYSLFGFKPLPFHFFNVVLHIINTWLVFKLAEKLSGKSITGFIVAILFAIHPMHVESVAWISERKDLLYTLFYLSALVAYLRFAASEKFNAKYYFLTLLLFIASLFSKSAAVTLPVMLIAIDLYKSRKINFRNLLEKAPFFLLSLLFGVIAILSQRSAINEYTLSYSIIERVFIFSYTIVFYMIKVVAPFELSAMYLYPDSGTDLLPWQYYASLPVLIFLAFIVVRKNIIRKEIVFGVFFFLISISVMLQIIPVGSAIVCDRYTYVPYIGLFFIFAQWISSVWTKKIKTVAIFVFVLFVVVFSIKTYVRIGVWKNGIVLFTDVINKYPGNYLGYTIRGDFKNDKKDISGALEDYNMSIKINPKFAKSLNNRALIYYNIGDFNSAIPDLNSAISIKPDFAEAYYNRANVYKSLGDIDRAILDYNKTVSIKPDYSMAYNNRGLAYERKADLISAKKDYDKAIEINPELAQAYNNRSVINAKAGRLEEAIKDVNISISLEPDSAGSYSNRGNIKALQKDFRGSVDDFSRSLKLNPRDMKVHYNRALAYLNLKDTSAACEDWKIILASGDNSIANTVKLYCK